MVWKFDPELVRQRAILGVLFGCLAMIFVIAFILVYFLVLKPSQENQIKEEDQVFQCNS